MSRGLVALLACAACERARPTPPAEPCPPLVDARYEHLGGLTALWPQCPVDLPIESYAGRCLHGRHCMQPCAIERIDPSSATPDEIESLRYDAAGRLTASRLVSVIGTLPPLESRCTYDPEGRPLACNSGELATAFEYAGGHLAALHETRSGKRYADEREQWDGDVLLRTLRSDDEGAPEPDTAYTYDDGRLVAVHTDDTRTTLGYDAHGHVSRIVIATGREAPRTITLHYDDAGRLRERLEDLGEGAQRTTYRYDGERLVDEVAAYGTIELYRTHYRYDCK